MKLLDLFCGAGGAAEGYSRAGFDEITGVDIEDQPSYPFEFIRADALDIDLSGFDLIHASPPCLRWSSASGKSSIVRNNEYPDLLRQMRVKLQRAEIWRGTPYVIENVEGAPLIRPIKLCGTMFNDLRVLRHRLFECSFGVEQPELNCRNHPPIWDWKDVLEYPDAKPYVTVAGGGKAPLWYSRNAMGIDWMNQKELSQAIPPIYTYYIGKFAMIYLEGRDPVPAKQD